MLNSDTAKIISNLLAGIGALLALIIILGAVAGIPYLISSKNNEKVQNMTELCISQGYDGWQDEDSRDGEAVSACYND